MLLVNGERLKLGHYPDGTLLLKPNEISDVLRNDDDKVIIKWHYENDEELFALMSITRHLQRVGYKVSLDLPYIPNARMDRVKDENDVFTLKYFAEFINSLNFENVFVLDPHSNVSEALINNISVERPFDYIQRVIANIKIMLIKDQGNLCLFYPDEGAMKRYSSMIPIPYAFGIKNRDWKTGNILGLTVNGKEVVKGANVLIVDDICSKGGTFYYSAKALKECGAKKIYLYITHCENTILKGEVLTSGLIERVYTTDSICTVKNEKVVIL